MPGHHPRSRSPARPARAGGTDERLLGGVAAGPRRGTSASTSLPVRAAFLLLGRPRRVRRRGCTPACGWCCPPTPTSSSRRPGLEAATRQGKRPGRGSRRLQDVGPLVAARRGRARRRGARAARCSAAPLLFWPAAARRGRAGGAVAAGRRGAARAVAGQHRPDRPRCGPWSAAAASAAWARLAAGVGLLLAALVLFAAADRAAGQSVARDVVVAGVLGVVGLALMVGPWLFRLTGDLVRGARRAGARRRSAPTWPRTCTTRCCRRWR